MSSAHSKPGLPIIARLVRLLSIPIILLWLLFAFALSTISPPLEEVATQHAVSMTPQQAPAFQAMMHIGRVFHEFDTDSTAMVVLEGQDKLGDSAHDFYNRIVGQLRADTAHVENVEDFWSAPWGAHDVVVAQPARDNYRFGGIRISAGF